MRFLLRLRHEKSATYTVCNASGEVKCPAVIGSRLQLPRPSLLFLSRRPRGPETEARFNRDAGVCRGREHDRAESTAKILRERGQTEALLYCVPRDFLRVRLPAAHLHPT